jgi:hypothetical protein
MQEVHKREIERYKLIEEKAESVERYVAEELIYDDSEPDEEDDEANNNNSKKAEEKQPQEDVECDGDENDNYQPEDDNYEGFGIEEIKNQNNQEEDVLIIYCSYFNSNRNMKYKK